MNTRTQHVPDSDIRGVRPADQERSVILQQKFVAAARAMLLDARLADIPIPVLARKAKSSVGGFYSRFESKEALLDFMRMQMLHENKNLFDDHLNAARFAGKSHHDVSAAFVDFMLQVYSSPWRGVIREAYLALRERPETWEPIRQRSQLWCERVIGFCAPLVARRDGLEERVAVAVQLLFSALNNEMMNPHLAFGIKDPKFRLYLVLSFDTLIAGQFEKALSDSLDRARCQP